MNTKAPLIIAFGAALCLQTAAFGQSAEAGFKSIFNGKDLTGWEGVPELWSVKDGTITAARIVLGGGSRSWKVIAPSSILLTLPNVEVVEGLAAPAPPRPSA